MHDTLIRPDNKIRLSPDVLEKAQAIASEWGLKNARAAVEAVFRRYADDYLGGGRSPLLTTPAIGFSQPRTIQAAIRCEALDELDALLGM